MESHEGGMKRSPGLRRALAPAARTLAPAWARRGHHSSADPPFRLVVAARPATRKRVHEHRWGSLRVISKVLVLLAGLQVLDLVSTLLLLSIGGIEANPVSS